MSEKPLLQIVIEQAGHKCVFLPKFHCELNPIELVWAQVKHYFRERADGTFPTAKKLAIESLNSVSTEKIRRCFSHCWRYLDHYRGGMDITKAEYAMKQFKSHRRIPGAGRVPAM
ncbi:hypothetical protein BDN72DRAFT_782883 [Pluteus cervinus]|uniref:Uncharacterized protein n=1 Tax=Pluteus cervinus TaxID=181527 RepID=A0ACD2ZW83_9AGAR|nr:hypothetical protein BDN72DRAFT_782883 [Pluteus cervinus]